MLSKVQKKVSILTLATSLLCILGMILMSPVALANPLDTVVYENCFYHGHQYSPGSKITVDGRELTCQSNGTWF
ncbi:hypothetical protein NIES2098_04410 [Calothrix sp. NIES-2098]|nr:hypothetical protein NIES2098_04410 [Calothrix sp. NIES-2098]